MGDGQTEISVLNFSSRFILFFSIKTAMKEKLIKQNYTFHESIHIHRKHYFQRILEQWKKNSLCVRKLGVARDKKELDGEEGEVAPLIRLFKPINKVNKERDNKK